MRLFVQVVPLTQDTAAFIRAAVADIGRFIEFVADLFLKRGTEFVATAAKGAPPCAVGLVLAELDALTFPAFGAAVVGVMRRKLVTLTGAFLNLAGDGGGAFAELRRDSFERTALFQQNLNLQTVGVGQVFVLSHNKKLLTMISQDTQIPL